MRTFGMGGRTRTRDGDAAALSPDETGGVPADGSEYALLDDEGGRADRRDEADDTPPSRAGGDDEVLETKPDTLPDTGPLPSLKVHSWDDTPVTSPVLRARGVSCKVSDAVSSAMCETAASPGSDAESLGDVAGADAKPRSFISGTIPST